MLSKTVQIIAFDKEYEQCRSMSLILLRLCCPRRYLTQWKILHFHSSSTSLRNGNEYNCISFSFPLNIHCNIINLEILFLSFLAVLLTVYHLQSTSHSYSIVTQKDNWTFCVVEKLREINTDEVVLMFYNCTTKKKWNCRL